MYLVYFSVLFGLIWFHFMAHMGGARGVMVMVVGNEHGDTSSNPGRY